MKDLSTDPKQAAILQSAWQAFATYGFRKTSMDDIARGAGMSRPALYLHYKGKDEIFRSLVEHYYDKATGAVAEALAAPGAPRDVLRAAFHAQAGEIMETMMRSPHGHELLDAGAATAADVKQAGEAHLHQLYADWLGRTAEAGQVRLAGTPQDMAETIGSALKGLKDSGLDYPDFIERLDLLSDLIGAGLEA